jgi:patatin-like phospholipase/acyl hydrolase
MKQEMKYLAISGGGIGGDPVAYILSHLEKFNPTIKFDGYAGTSVGAIIAVLLTAGYKPTEVFEILSENLDKVFTLNGWWARKFGAAKYTNKYLERLLKQYLGNKKMCELEYPCYLVAYQAEGGDRFEVFGPDCKHPAYLCTMASAAAPIYFDSVEIDGIKYGDGGLVANMPSTTLLCHEAHRIGEDPRNFYLCSIVTGGTSKFIKNGYKAGSYFSFMKKVAPTVINANVDKELTNASKLLGDKHCILRPDLPDFELDSIKAVKGLRRSWYSYMAFGSGFRDFRKWFYR